MIDIHIQKLALINDFIDEGYLLFFIEEYKV